MNKAFTTLSEAFQNNIEIFGPSFPPAEILYGSMKSWELINSLTQQLLSYRNQSIVLMSKSTDWFLCDGNFGV